MRILVTGSNGFLGTHLCAELRKRGHAVVGLDLTHHGELRCDVTKYRQLDKFSVIHPHVVYHLAGEFGRKNSEFYEQMWETNVLGTRNVIEFCLENKAKLIFASSSEAYGDLCENRFETGTTRPFPLKEEMLEKLVPKFGNEYALSKYTNEKQIEIARQHGLNARILRFFNAYGPGERYSPYRSVVCLFVSDFLHNRNPVAYRSYCRSFLYIDDWTATVANVCERYDSLQHDCYNIAGADYTSIEQLVEIIQKVIPESSSRPFWKDTDPFNVRTKRADISRAVAELGLKQSVSLEEGIRRTAEWMKNG